MSSGAAYGQADHPDYLYGNLDQILGALNIDAGSGRHQLMISDEAALVGDNDVRITDAPGSEILVSGLAPAPITFKAAANGTFADGVTIWTGSGNDRIHIDATHERAGVRTVTSLNTGLGDDDVTVDLQAGQRRLLRARHPGRLRARRTTVGGGSARGRPPDPADSVRAWIEGVPRPVAYQPDGRVRLLATGRLAAPVRVEVTRTYRAGLHRSARAPHDHLPGRRDRRRRHGHRVTGQRPAGRLHPQRLDSSRCTGATDGALAIVTVVRTETPGLHAAARADAADNDTVHAETSTLPLIIFGGVGNDTINGGRAAT